MKIERKNGMKEKDKEMHKKIFFCLVIYENCKGKIINIFIFFPFRDFNKCFFLISFSDIT